MSSEPLVRMPKDLIEEYWKGNAKKKKTTPTKIVYVGSFFQHKNVLRLINAVLLLRKKYPKMLRTTDALYGKLGREAVIGKFKRKLFGR